MCNLQFVLIVDDFSILKKEDLDHLLNTLHKYDVMVDLERKEYIKIELDLDYAEGKVHLSMKQCLNKALQ